MRTAGNPVKSLVFPGLEHFYRKIEAVRLYDNGRVLAYGLVAAVHIAMKAPRACLGASVPEVPADRQRTPRISILFLKKG